MGTDAVGCLRGLLIFPTFPAEFYKTRTNQQDQKVRGLTPRATIFADKVTSSSSASLPASQFEIILPWQSYHGKKEHGHVSNSRKSLFAVGPLFHPNSY